MDEPDWSTVGGVKSMHGSAWPGWLSLPWARLDLIRPTLYTYAHPHPDLDSAPPTKATVTKAELVDYLKQMYTMRRMEITCDTEYKVRDVPTSGKGAVRACVRVIDSPS